ncbi:hypothetical protein CERZMDRAFT_91073 [Cercospora zeae-maydis SCOH1-5]|uniref:Uncharacterized protein n=1 Tax=Cercospora zeae-maydis SCOH1-5 TaxID=717836 RepID=A0A6A6FBX3_9PEZI|nr:hypothetical protein CERZMDRAFT_91073 [Cercospora zeae-maydis SCOH1-5]
MDIGDIKGPASTDVLAGLLIAAAVLIGFRSRLGDILRKRRAECCESARAGCVSSRGNGCDGGPSAQAGELILGP